MEENKLMNLHRLDKTLDKYQSILGDNNSNNNINPELEQAKAFLAQRRELYLKAHKKRMDNWFAAHPDKQYFEESYEDFVRDCEFDEWYWYAIERLQDSPEQRYQREKMSPLDHDSSFLIRGLDRYDGQGCNQFIGCVESCRFYLDIGRIEDSEIIESYRRFQQFDEVYNIWLEASANKKE
jgi:hypothetical protein